MLFGTLFEDDICIRCNTRCCWTAFTFTYLDKYDISCIISYANLLPCAHILGETDTSSTNEALIYKLVATLITWL